MLLLLGSSVWLIPLQHSSYHMSRTDVLFLTILMLKGAEEISINETG